MNFIRHGKYTGTYQVEWGVWSTHIPQAVIEKGNLDRPGKASVREVLKPRRRW
jgi:hypothetical protein